jgi:itaconate CoA-transferase
MTGVLDGVLVVSLEQAVAAPFASSKLADAGARVIKIERESGDFARSYDHVVHGESAYFVWLNRGKESVVLDIKSEGDAALLRAMLTRADVFIQNLAPGAVERSGFGSASLRRAHPRLVTCDISGYGEEGPYAEMKAYDNLLQGETGLLAVTGHPDAAAKVGISIADISAGIHAYAGILEALIRRERTGEGTGLKVSLFDCLADWMSVPYLHQAYGGAAPPRTGLHHASIAPYGPYASRDGREVMIAIQNEREWARFCATVLDRPALATDPAFRSNSRRVENRAELDAILVETLGSLPLDTVLERLKQAAIAFGRLNSVEDFARHPQLRRLRVDTPTGPVELPAPAVRRVNGAPSSDTGSAGQTAGAAIAVPGLGQHTEAVRREFGERVGR